MSFSLARVGVRNDFIAVKANQNKDIFPPVHYPAGKSNNILAFYSKRLFHQVINVQCAVLVPSSGEVSTNTLKSFPFPASKGNALQYFRTHCLQPHVKL